MREKLQRTFLWRDATIEQLYFDNFAIFSQDMQKSLLAPGAARAHRGAGPVREGTRPRARLRREHAAEQAALCRPEDLPPGAVDEAGPDEHGRFPVPVGTWFRGRFRHVVDEYVLGERVRERGMLNCAALERLVAERDHAQRLWSLVNLEMWMRQAIEATP
jgi:hypothetical protein